MIFKLPPSVIQYINPNGTPTRDFYEFLQALVSNQTPIGTIIQSLSPIPPNGYLALGTTFNRTVYPELFALLGTDTLPGVEDGLYLMASPTVGAIEGSNYVSIAHYHMSTVADVPTGTALGAGGNTDGYDVQPQTIENRPRSLGVNFYIKATN